MSLENINFRNELDRLEALCSDPSASEQSIHKSIEVLRLAGYQSEVLALLKAALKNTECHSAVGPAWVRMKAVNRQWGLSSELAELMKRGPIGRASVIAYAEELGAAGRASSLLALLKDHRSWLHASDEGWNSVAIALGSNRKNSRLLTWTRDWEARPAPGQTALFYRALALARRWRFREARRVGLAALEKPVSDMAIHQRLLVAVAVEESLRGDPVKARDLLRDVESHGLEEMDARFYRVARAVSEVRLAPISERRDVLESGLKRIAKSFHKVPVWRRSFSVQRTVQLGLWRLAIASRNPWPLLWGYWKFYGRVLLAGLGILIGLMLFPFVGIWLLFFASSPCCWGPLLVLAAVAYAGARQSKSR